MGRIDRPTRPELPESTDWARIAKIAGGCAAAALLLWLAYAQATRVERSPVIAVRRPTPPRVVYVAVPQAPPPAPKPAPVEPPPSEPKPEEHSTVIEAVAPAPIVHAPEPQPDRPREKPETLREAIHRCIVLSAEVDTSQPFVAPISVNAKVHLRNMCGMDFPGASVWFDATAYSNSGIAGTDYGHFENVPTIQSFGTAETLVQIQCDPERVTRIAAKLR
jgi:hypothetical protein